MPFYMPAYDQYTRGYVRRVVRPMRRGPGYINGYPTDKDMLLLKRQIEPDVRQTGTTAGGVAMVATVGDPADPAIIQTSKQLELT